MQITRRFYFPGAAAEAGITVKLWHVCQKNKAPPRGQRGHYGNRHSVPRNPGFFSPVRVLNNLQEKLNLKCLFCALNHEEYQGRKKKK